MIHKVKDLLPEENAAIERLLGRSIAENEQISIRTVDSPPAPDWLRKSWESSQQQGVDQLSPEEIDAEIVAARTARRDHRSSDR